MELLRTETVVELGKVAGLGLSSLATPFDVLDGANGQQSLNLAVMLRSATVFSRLSSSHRQERRSQKAARHLDGEPPRSPTGVSWMQRTRKYGIIAPSSCQTGLDQLA
ncbi:MAG: hypothetical protein E3J21_00760 [Anaerolineales bacterium]|nr:MAG: hypothetical protein E3J21_00760 [Anaerolineales bacterium]